MALRRDGWFKQLFRGNQRLDDTVTALRTMLEKARLPDAVKELDAYLAGQGGNRNRIQSGDMLRILNRHLPARGSSMEELMESAGIVKDDNRLGNGIFGAVYPIEMGGKPYVMKELLFSDEQPFSLDRTGEVSEAIGSYLTSRSDPDYLKRVNISEPTFYMVSVSKPGTRPETRPDDFRLVSPHQMRALVGQATSVGGRVKCHGLIMPKAEGREAGKLRNEGRLTEDSRRQYIRGMLTAVKGLDERGFVHRDIKPENSFFDESTGKTTLVDTGTLFKARQRGGGPEYTEVRDVGTPTYMHPRITRGERHGTEADVYSLGLTSLEMDHPKAFGHLRGEITDRNRAGIAVTREWLIEAIARPVRDDRGRVQEPDSATRADLEALRRDLDRPETLTGFGMECLDRAQLPAEYWKAHGQDEYEQLLRRLDGRVIF
ncbi:MAG: hypothetical protein JOY81_06795 [Alphaproteobacteria bacterium]|nr:hypothetical protein [Alphaproteobacteria bacterium]